MFAQQKKLTIQIYLLFCEKTTRTINQIVDFTDHFDDEIAMDIIDLRLCML
jgi:hypothetical protein